MGIVPIMGAAPGDTQWRLPAIPCKGGVGGSGTTESKSPRGTPQIAPKPGKKPRKCVPWQFRNTKKNISKMVVEGTVKAIFDTVQVSDTFKRREFVLEVTENPLYPQLVTFQFIQDRVSLLDNFTEGEKVEVTFNLRGREWTAPSGEKKYFNTLEAWRINPAQSSDGSKPAESPVYDMPDDPGDGLPF